MGSDDPLARALRSLAEREIGDRPVEPGQARRAAASAIGRARRRLAARIAVPAVIVVIAASGTGIALRSSSSTDQVATAGRARAAAPARPRPAPSHAKVAVPAVTASLLSRPVVVAGWTITQVPAGVSGVSTTATIADFGPTGAGCAGKPTVAVTVYNHPTFSIDSELRTPRMAANAVPLPVAGTTGVEESPPTSSSCPQERFVLYQPSDTTIIQIATTTTGVAGAQIVAQGISSSG